VSVTLYSSTESVRLAQTGWDMLEAVRLEPTEALRECKAGGHCLYAVLAYCLFGDMNRYPVLRQLVADAFRNDDLVMRVVHPVVPLEDADEIRTHLCKRREGGAVEDFLFNVRSGNAYAEIEEAATIGSLFNLTVTIISPDSDPVVLEPVCSNGSEAAKFRALLPSIQDGRISLTAPPQPPTAVKVANANVHYKAVISGLGQGQWQSLAPVVKQDLERHYSKLDAGSQPVRTVHCVPCLMLAALTDTS